MPLNLSTLPFNFLEKMSILSLTFHCSEKRLHEWQEYVTNVLTLLTENLMDVDQYVLSEVGSEMINEGKNYNLLLTFANEELREDFLESEFENIKERIEKNFGDDVMIFKTFLNPIKLRF